ncbi:MAG: CRISPR-associated endonuclease Cas2 [Lentisphaeria bacterium]|nr:CRISPR-associated endonuclease Cas2 [Lentisphaeria bacterium]
MKLYLPVLTPPEQKAYRVFRKLLHSYGFSAIQHSVYRRWVDEKAHAAIIVRRIKNNLPCHGKVFILKIPQVTQKNAEYFIDQKNIASPEPPTPWKII